MSAYVPEAEVNSRLSTGFTAAIDRCSGIKQKHRRNDINPAIGLE